jgi:hypothetical protein
MIHDFASSQLTVYAKLMKRFLAYFSIAFLLQVIGLVFAIILIGGLGAELPIMVMLYLYFPTIILVEKTGNFVGCANMVQPFILGVPLGILIYSLMISLVISRIKRAAG